MNTHNPHSPKRKKITWTSNTFLSSLGHDTGFSTSEGFSKEKVHQDWTSYHCQYLGLTIPHLAEFKHHECPCKRFAIDDFGDHLHTCMQHAGVTSDTHEHILTAPFSACFTYCLTAKKQSTSHAWAS